MGQPARCRRYARSEHRSEFARTHKTRHPESYFGSGIARYPVWVTISVVLITQDEEKNLPGTLESVMPLVRGGKGEIIIVDSGSSDRTLEIARSHGAKIFSEPWKGFAAQKNSAIAKASCDWVLQLDADEPLEPELAAEIQTALNSPGEYVGFWIPRKNFFLGRWINHGGFYPDPKLRLFRRGCAVVAGHDPHDRVDLMPGVASRTRQFTNPLVHYTYPTLTYYISHMNRYSSLGAQDALAKGRRSFSIANIVIRPLATFFYNYVVRLGFLDGREGLLLHLYHAVYVSWKYAKAWELARNQKPSPPLSS
jgi:glycosyltransferase involved in cell wall biosynthesis